jgi:hypothetical protein
MNDRLTLDERRALKRTVDNVNGKGWAIGFGLVLGLGLFAATNFLVIKGGPDVGLHLRLLNVYFPGYSVTFIGSLIGFVYAFVLGYLTGRIVVGLYNRFSVLIG